MASSEAFCLKWNDFQNNIRMSFKELRNSDNFSDVTLVSDDNKSFTAHQIVLASSSLFFASMLNGTKHPHPLVYLRGCAGASLAAILDFMYLGEVSVARADMHSFMAVAGDLGVRGLTANTEDSPGEGEDMKTKEEITQCVEVGEKERAGIKSEPLLKVELKSPDDLQLDYGIDHIMEAEVEEENIEENLSGIDAKLTERIDAMMERRGGQWGCNMCPKAMSRKKDMRRHMESRHTQGLSYTCTICGKSLKTTDALRRHKYEHSRSTSGAQCTMNL